MPPRSISRGLPRVASTAEQGLSPWDTAAGCLLVREAGGFVTDFRGRSQPICDSEVLAGNDALHSKLHKTLVGALKPAA